MEALCQAYLQTPKRWRVIVYELFTTHRNELSDNAAAAFLRLQHVIYTPICTKCGDSKLLRWLDSFVYAIVAHTELPLFNNTCSTERCEGERDEDVIQDRCRLFLALQNQHSLERLVTDVMESVLFETFPPDVQEAFSRLQVYTYMNTDDDNSVEWLVEFAHAFLDKRPIPPFVKTFSVSRRDDVVLEAFALRCMTEEAAARYSTLKQNLVRSVRESTRHLLGLEKTDDDTARPSIDIPK